MYEIVETANGWIVQPNMRFHRDGYPIDFSNVYVFNDIRDLNRHLAETLKTIPPKTDARQPAN